MCVGMAAATAIGVALVVAYGSSLIVLNLCALPDEDAT